MEIPEVRRRLRGAIEQARKSAQERRQRSDQAAQAYDEFLEQRAVPVFHVVAAALTAEGHPFKVFTPAGAVRLAAQGTADDFIEVVLDATADPPAVMGRSSRGRGRRNVSTERPLKKGVPVPSLSDEDVLEFILAEIPAFVTR